MRIGGVGLLLGPAGLWAAGGFTWSSSGLFWGSHHTHQHVASPQSNPVAWLGAHWPFCLPAQLWLPPALRASLGEARVPSVIPSTEQECLLLPGSSRHHPLGIPEPFLILR